MFKEGGLLSLRIFVGEPEYREGDINFRRNNSGFIAPVSRFYLYLKKKISIE